MRPRRRSSCPPPGSSPRPTPSTRRVVPLCSRQASRRVAVTAIAARKRANEGEGVCAAREVPESSTTDPSVHTFTEETSGNETPTHHAQPLRAAFGVACRGSSESTASEVDQSSRYRWPRGLGVSSIKPSLLSSVARVPACYPSRRNETLPNHVGCGIRCADTATFAGLSLRESVTEYSSAPPHSKGLRARCLCDSSQSAPLKRGFSESIQQECVGNTWRAVVRAPRPLAAWATLPVHRASLER